MTKTYDEEIADSLREQNLERRFTTTENSMDLFSRLREEFPASGSRIQWDEVPGAVEEFSKSRESELADFRRFFFRIVREKELKGEMIYIGDSLTERCYVCEVQDFEKVVEIFLEIPQHHFLIGKDFRWCMSFMFEGYMGFGFKF